MLGDTWKTLGFAAPPERRWSPSGGILLYRCWGGGSTEWGGYFSVERPASVVDAELRFNIADWGNLIYFVSTFRLRAGFDYWIGPIAHGERDLFGHGTQVYVAKPLDMKLDLVASKDTLKYDAVVGGPGNAS